MEDGSFVKPAARELYSLIAFSCFSLNFIMFFPFVTYSTCVSWIHIETIYERWLQSIFIYSQGPLPWTLGFWPLHKLCGIILKIILKI